MRVDVNEILCYRKLLCAIIEQADLDIKSSKNYEDMYKQAEAEFGKESAYCWVFDKHEYGLRFEDICNALGIDPEPILSLYKKHYEKYKLSLVKAAKIKLTNLRIKNIFGNSFTQDFCTFDDQTNFFSYRRSNDSGRMVSLIWIED